MRKSAYHPVLRSELLGAHDYEDAIDEHREWATARLDFQPADYTERGPDGFVRQKRKRRPRNEVFEKTRAAAKKA